jgi:hypothetical protein
MLKVRHFEWRGDVFLILISFLIFTILKEKK